MRDPIAPCDCQCFMLPVFKILAIPMGVFGIIILICNSLMIYIVKFHFNNNITEKYFPSIDRCRYFVMNVFKLRENIFIFNIHHGLNIKRSSYVTESIFLPCLASFPNVVFWLCWEVCMKLSCIKGNMSSPF